MISPETGARLIDVIFILGLGGGIYLLFRARNTIREMKLSFLRKQESRVKITNC